VAEISSNLPILLIGAGNMGGALVAGWLASGAVDARSLILIDPTPGEAARAAVAAGAGLNPPRSKLLTARTVVIAVKPQTWRVVVAELAPYLAGDATVISVMAGVAAADLRAIFASQPIVRVMPTTAAAVGKGAASLWSRTAEARAAARALFSPLGAVIDLADEDMIHAATAASGSAPAYFYAMVEAMQHAAKDVGLEPEAARLLARAALIGAAALLDCGGAEASELRRQVTSPGGTTEAALRVLAADGALDQLMVRAVRAAAARSRELAS